MKRLLAITILLAAAACDDIFEKDLSKKSVAVIAPVDGVAVEAGQVAFLWRATEGARAYRVTVVSPSFAQAAQVVADTLMRNDSLSAKLLLRLDMQPGNYAWSIRAQNEGYATADQFYSLTVVPAPDEP